MKQKQTFGKWIIDFRFLLLLIMIGGVIPMVYVKKGGVDPVLVPHLFVLAIFNLVIGFITAYKVIISRQVLSFSKVEIYVLIFSVGYLCIMLLSSCFAINRHEAFYEVIKAFSLSLFLFYLILLLNDGVEEVLILGKAVLIMMLVYIVIGLLQVLMVDFSEFLKNTQYLDYFYTKAINEVSSLLANKNLFSSILLYSFSFSVIGVFKYRRAWLIISWVVLIFSLTFMGVLVAKSVWMGLATSVAIALILMTFQIFQLKGLGNFFKFSLKKGLILLSILIILVIGIAGSVKFTDGKIITVVSNKLKTIINPDNFDRDKLMKLENPGSAQTRIIVWFKSMDMFNDNPLLGVGPGNWRVNINRYNLDSFESAIRQGNHTWDRPHNDYVWVLSETGVAGFLIYFGLFFYILILCIQLVLNSKDHTIRFMAVVLAASLCGYAVQSFFDFPKERITHNLIRLIIFAAIIKLLNHDSNSRKYEISQKATKYGIFGIVFLSLITLFSVYQKLNAELLSSKVVQNQLSGKWNAELKYLNRIQGWSCSVNTQDGKPFAWYKGIALAQMGRLDEGMISFQEAYQICPYDLSVLSNLGTIYFIKKDKVKAEEYYLKALEISSTYNQAILNLAILYSQLGKIERAYQTLSRFDLKAIGKVEVNDPTYTEASELQKKYTKTMGLILEMKVEKMVSKIKNKYLVQKLKQVMKDQSKLINLHNKSLKTGKTFKEELLLSFKK